MKQESIRKRSNMRIVAALTATVIAMFGFGYALVPLYDLFCEITGVGGKPAVAAQQSDSAVVEIDETRDVTIEFTGNATNGMPWIIRPEVRKTRVNPGEIREVLYRVKNTSGRNIVGQAIPSVSPMQVAKHFVKLECFCFRNQTLAAGEERLMPVRFYVDSKAPDDIKTITLSYSFFEVDTKNVSTG